MKLIKTSIYTLFLSFSSFFIPMEGNAQIFPVSKPIQTTQSAEFLNIETPFRCTVDELKDQKILTTIALTDQDFKLSYFDYSDTLPRYEVNGFSFRNLPVDEAFQQLLEEAKITVYTEDGSYPELNAQDVFGELTTVVSELAKAGDVFYRYDAKQKALYLSRSGRFELKLPNNRLVMFALLDALRGAGIQQISPNWENSSLILTLNYAEKQKVQSLLDQILKESKLLLADTQVYHISPAIPQASWQKVIEEFGAGRVYTTNAGLVGKLISIGHHKKSQDLLASISRNYIVSPVSEGIAIVPNNWKMRFDIGKCAHIPGLETLSLLLSTQIKSTDKVDTNVTLDTKSGELTAFNVVAAIDDELAIIGIPRSYQGYPDGELLITLKLRYIRLVKGN